jgi:hypothetical protein
MDSIVTFFCIIGLCIFMYGYIRMRKSKINQKTCNLLYIPERPDDDSNELSYMDVLDHEGYDSKFKHTRSQLAPMGDNDLPSRLNLRYDKTNLSVSGE